MALTAPLAATAASAGSRRHLVRNVAVLLSSQLVTWSLSLLWTVFVPRALGPARMGELTVATSVSSVLGAVVGLGIGTLMVKEIARDHARAPRLVGTALLVRTGLLLPSVLVVGLYTNLAHTPPELALVIWLAVAGMLVGLFAGPFLAALQAMEKMQYTAYSDVLSKAAVAAGGIALVLAGFGLVHLMALSLAMSVVALLLSWRWSRPHFRVDLHSDRAGLRELTLGSLPYWTTGLLLTFYMWIDSLLLSWLAPLHVVGWYGVPTKLFGTLLFIPVILSTAYLPRLSRAFHEGNDELRGEASTALELVLVLSLPIAVGTVLVARPLVWVLYGAPFLPAAPVLAILACCIPPTYLNIMANQVLVATNRQVDWTKVMAGAAVVNPLLNLVLIGTAQSRWGNGALGAALALLLTEVGMALAGLLLMPPILGRSSLFRLGRAAAATIGMGASVGLVAIHFGLAAQVATGVVAFCVLAVLFRVLSGNPQAELERQLARALARLPAPRRSLR